MSNTAEITTNIHTARKASNPEAVTVEVAGGITITGWLAHRPAEGPKGTDFAMRWDVTDASGTTYRGATSVGVEGFIYDETRAMVGPGMTEIEKACRSIAAARAYLA